MLLDSLDFFLRHTLNIVTWNINLHAQPITNLLQLRMYMYSEQMYIGWVLRTSLVYFLENVLFIQLRKVSEDTKNKTRIQHSPTQS